MVAIHKTSLMLASIALLSSYVNAYGQIAQVVDENNFCVFLPPSDSVDRGIADTEWNAQAFCIGKTPLATNAGKLSSGFIQSAHYLATEKYVQVTGVINPSKARLNATDEGGQYDIKAPKGSSCAGWKYYVNLVEPAGNTYCMRCCNDDRSCNRGISEKGCAHIIPGDYSGPGSSSTTKKITTTTTNPKKITSTTTTKKAVTKTTRKVTNTTTTKKATTTTTVSAQVIPTPKANVAANIDYNTNNNENVDDTTAAPTPTFNANTANPVEPTITDTTNAIPASNNSDNVNLLSQNNVVSEQSVNGATQYKPSIVAFGLVVMGMMFQ